MISVITIFSTHVQKFLIHISYFYRRVYNVAGPHHLWHHDGHHKLIRYGLITHGCVDGFSRTVIYLGDDAVLHIEQFIFMSMILTNHCLTFL